MIRHAYLVVTKPVAKAKLVLGVRGLKIVKSVKTKSNGTFWNHYSPLEAIKTSPTRQEQIKGYFLLQPNCETSPSLHLAAGCRCSVCVCLHWPVPTCPL